MSTSHACGLGDENHMPGEIYQRYHVEKARGGLALTMFGGSSYVAEDSLWASGQLNVATGAVIPYLRRFSERIHAEGAAIMIQITHLGRRAETNTQNWLPTMAPSVVREIGHRSIPREMDRKGRDALGLLAEADLRLAALFRRQNQPEVAVPVLVEVVKLMTPAQPQGRKAYQNLIELGFVDTEFKSSAPSGN